VLLRPAPHRVTIPAIVIVTITIGIVALQRGRRSLHDVMITAEDIESQPS
jgi:hypothetical protein